MTELDILIQFHVEEVLLLLVCHGREAGDADEMRRIIAIPSFH